MTPLIRYPPRQSDGGADAVWKGRAALPEERVVDPPDTLLDKLHKYVPAPTLAFFVPLATVPDTDGARWGLVALAYVVTAAYLWARRPTRWYTWALTFVSLAAWIVGATDYGAALLELDEAASRVILGFSVAVIPLLDQGLSRTAR